MAAKKKRTPAGKKRTGPKSTNQAAAEPLALEQDGPVHTKARIPPISARAKEIALMDRRKRVGEGYLRGLSQWDLARQEGVDQAQISRDLTWLHEQWLACAEQDTSARKAQELAKIDRLEAVAIAAWERSCRDAEILFEATTSGRTTKDGDELPDLEKKSKTVKGQSGDPRFLERIGWCIDERCKILGIVSKAPGGDTFNGPCFKIYAGFDPEQV